MNQEGYRLLEQILEETQSQETLMAKEETEPLLESIARRQKLIDRLETLGISGENAGDQRTKELYARISEQDQRNEQAALGRLATLREQMRKLRDGKKAFGGYEKVVSDPGATYFDKKQ